MIFLLVVFPVSVKSSIFGLLNKGNAFLKSAILGLRDIPHREIVSKETTKAEDSVGTDLPDIGRSYHQENS